VDELRELAYEMRTNSGSVPLVNWIMANEDYDQKVIGMEKDILGNGIGWTEMADLVLADPGVRRLWR